jgi:hypothetical protein
MRHARRPWTTRAGHRSDHLKKISNDWARLYLGRMVLLEGGTAQTVRLLISICCNSASFNTIAVENDRDAISNSIINDPTSFDTLA